ncbi:glycosyltransferase family 4 protein, partial [Citrobacter sp. Igbk 16]|uniref:glycosyltransferase family 4 protein n=1 Tax=Citrobacter sp. Igbk 16 TaxID=2963958 RepID=UPI002302ED4B
KIFNDVIFLVAGECQTNINRYLKSVNIPGSNIIYIGEIDNYEREKIYAISDVVVFPSRYESFGLVPLEAFVHGKPIIASNAGAIPEVVINNECGLIFEDGNAEDLAAKIKSIMADDVLREHLGKGAYKRVRELSSYNSANKTIHLYNDLIRDMV